MSVLIKQRRRITRITDNSAARALTEIYNEYFEVIPAFTPQQRQEVYRLRYQVLCQERLLLKPEDYPSELECDIHDLHAMHCLLMHRPSDLPAGTMRVIMPDKGEHMLPSFTIYPAFAGLLDMATTAELSRLCISRQMRRRWNDGPYGRVHDAEHQHVEGKRRIPHAALGMFREVLAMLQGRDITHVCALMEPALAETLKRLGLHFAPAGPAIDHFGLRQPCYAKISSLLQRMEHERPDVWGFITDGGRLG
jgi:N-acyl amino acid synthase of PEP-CTERM/exosortase system